MSICIDVSDLAAATRFYVDALDCVLKEEKASHNTLDCCGSTLHLASKEEGSDAAGAGTPRRFQRHWTPVHLDFHVEDITPVVAKVESLGGVVEKIQDGAWGAAAFCADPYGNGFCLIALNTEPTG